MFASVRGVDFSKCREWKCFMEGVITPFEKALLCISERRYYAGFFRKALWRLLERCYYSFLIFKRRNDPFFYFALLCLFRVITTLRKVLLRLLIFFSTQFKTNKGFRTKQNIIELHKWFWTIVLMWYMISFYMRSWVLLLN